MANRKRETEAERAQRDREERIALLKMKQGIIEESELIPENEHVEAPKPRGLKWFSDYFYRNKAYVFMGAFFVFVMAILIGQLVTREKEDLYVLAIAFDENSEISWRLRDLETALERYCPDFDGNGKVHVTVNFIDRTSPEIATQYDQAQAQKLTMEFTAATAQFIIADEKFIEWINSNDTQNEFYYKKYFLDQSELCSEDMLFGDVGVRANRTELAEDARWGSCPDNVILLVRTELNNGAGSIKTNAENRERAMTVLQNIIDGNAVNSEAE